jgi:hypothetical protein
LRTSVSTHRANATDTQPLRDLRNRIAPLGDLSHRITLEIVAEIDFAHHGLLASKSGKKASTKLGGHLLLPFELDGRQHSVPDALPP